MQTFSAPKLKGPTPTTTVNCSVRAFPCPGVHLTGDARLAKTPDLLAGGSSATAPQCLELRLPRGQSAIRARAVGVHKEVVSKEDSDQQGVEKQTSHSDFRMTHPPGNQSPVTATSCGNLQQKCTTLPLQS